jgi:putative hydrolase of the HAD superfamily
MKIGPIRAITFDFWNTIMFAVDPSGQWRRDAWLELLAANGHVVEREAIGEAFQAAWKMHHRAWTENVQHSGTMFAAAAVDALGRDLTPALRAQLVEAFMHEGDGAQFIPCPGVAEALSGLESRGVRIGIVCDVGITPSVGLRRLLDVHGLLHYFDGWSFSDEVGRYKPAPEIFEHALAYLDSTPGETAHIGDIRWTDVAGARAIGMATIRYRGINDDLEDEPEADHVIDHHDELLGTLGLR